MKVFLFMVALSWTAAGQSISTGIPDPLDKSGKYFFYLHGAVVTVLGNNAINQSAPEWGPYEYLNILDSLRKRGFNVISENRRQGNDDSVYVNRVVRQVDSLLHAGVKARQILVVGASAGSVITLRAAVKLRNTNMHYAILGACWPGTYKSYENMELRGRFLSIIEASDPHGTCYRIFQNRKSVRSFKEIKLNTGLSHGFIYKGYREWIDPIVEWFGNEK